MRYLSIIIAFALFVLSCDHRKNQEAKSIPLATLSPRPPESIEKAILQEFPGAVPVGIFADTLFKQLADRYHISSTDILMGISTCVDDIIFIKNFHRHTEIKGPFYLGGLGGFPFSGISGLNAFSHHVPENGTMVLFVGPHIGYSSEKGWGSVLRPGQTHASSCCGALVGSLTKLENGKIIPAVIDPDDYEGDMINQFALQHEHEILNSPNHLVTFTKLASKEVESSIQRFFPKVDLNEEKYIVAIIGVLINTDFTYTDYLWVSHYKVYDVKNKVLLEDKSYP